MEQLFVICESSAISESHARGFVLMRSSESGEPQPWPILLTRKGKTVYGFENACPHLGLRLDTNPGQFMDESDNFLQCGHHEARFDLDSGKCFIGPCQGKHLPPLNLIIDDGDVCLLGVDLVDEE